MSTLTTAIELVRAYRRPIGHNPDRPSISLVEVHDACFMALGEALGIEVGSTGNLQSHWNDTALREVIAPFTIGLDLRGRATTLDELLSSAGQLDNERRDELRLRAEQLAAKHLGRSELKAANHQLAKDAEQLDKEKESTDEDHTQEVGKYFDLVAEWMLTLSEIDHVEISPLRYYAVEIATALGEVASELRVEPLEDPSNNLIQDWPPLVLTTREPRPVKLITEWLNDGSLRTRLNPQRSLIVLLGPGVTQATAAPVEAIEDVSSLFDGAEQIDREFFESLIASRRHTRVGSQHNGAGPSELDDLRRALVRAARLATSLLRKSEDPRPVNDWNSYATQLTADETNALREALQDASSLAGTLGTMEAGSDLDLLGATTLAARLQRLADEIAPEEGDSRIMGTEVNWLTDCAWHSLIFRSPLYPEVRELALQIDLCSGDETLAGPVRRLAPGEAIARDDLALVTANAARAVLRGFRSGRKVKDPSARAREAFYNAVAQRLWYEHDNRIGKPNPPLALSLTFDLELERALFLTQKSRSFHVLVPVLRRGDLEKVELRWLLGTYKGQSVNQPSAVARTLDPSSHSPLLGSLRTPNWSVGSDVPSGPVVVKLNGSPLHRLPRITSRGTRDTQSETALHALLLPEFDTMDIGVVSLVANATRHASGVKIVDKQPSRQAMPDWFLKSVATQSSRLWLVVGARWSDLSSRSQMFNMLSWPSPSSKRRESNHVVAVSKEIDLDRIHPLHWLDIQFVMGDCLDLIEDLRNATR